MNKTTRTITSILPFIQKLKLHSILGRLLLSSISLIAVVLAVAWWSHIKVSTANTSNTLQLSKRVQVNQQIRDISNKLWKIQTEFQSYMLVPDESSRLEIEQTMAALITEVQQLNRQNRIEKAERLQLITNLFSQRAAELGSSLDEVMRIRANPVLVFPAIPIMINQLNPAHSEFTNLANIALEETKELRKSPLQSRIAEHFNELRHAWLSKVSTFRMLASSRAGIFRTSAESSIRDAIYNIEIHNKQIQVILTVLQKLDDKQQLGFEQSLALASMHKINTEWNSNYEKVNVILEHEDSWRRDTPIIQNRINPLFTVLWGHIRNLGDEMEKRAVQDVHSTTMMADQVSNTLWLLVMAVALVTIIFTLLFDLQIRQPLVRIARALKAEAEGKAVTNLPDSPITETRDLVSAFTHLRQKVHSRQEHLQAVLTYAADAIITTDLDGITESFNPAAEFLFSYKDTDIIGKSITAIIPEFKKLVLRSNGSEIETYALPFFGEKLPVGINISKMHMSNRNLYLVMIADIRERQTMLEGIQAREQRLRSILDNTAEGIVTFDDHYQIETWNRAAERLFGWEEKEIYGSLFTRFIFSESNHDLCEIVKLHESTQFSGKDNEVIGRHKNGSHFPLSLKISKMILDGKVKYTALIANISERKAMMENLRYLAEHDSLTHLHNRAYFNTELEQIVNHAMIATQDYALLYIDLDNFKYINDTLGHAAGDKLLLEVASMLSRRARGSDVVARLGGDEFVVLIADVNKKTIESVAESYRSTLAEYDFHYEGSIVDIGCSIGVSIIDSTSASPSETLSQADVACHLAKRAGRNRVHMFSSKDADDVQTMSIDMGWSRRIRQALENDRFVLAVQPIYNIQRRDVESYEILIRLRDDDDSIIMPSGFLPTADRFGLSADIDAWVIRHAIKHLAYLNEKGISVRYAINLSGQSMTSPHIAELIPNLIKDARIDTSSLTFEVTETTAISDVDMAITLLTKLREMGCKTALDDFGSGMSSFAYLQELPVDIVKIDGRFVRNITVSSVDQAMVRAMNEIAHALDKQTVAEFVEHENHFKMLSVIGVDFAQGYHLGKPILIEEMAAALIDQSAKKSQSA